MGTRLSGPGRRAHVALGAGSALAVTAALCLAGVAPATAGGGPSPERARGLTYAGLVRASQGPCAGGWQVSAPGLEAVCTHGPDPAPAGVDVTAADITPATSTTLASATVPCIGDGASGPRVQVIYAVAADRTDRYADVAPRIVTWAGEMEYGVSQSAAQTGGERHVRFVTNPDCSLSIAKVALSATGDDTFGNTLTELRALGFDRTDRKYVVWADAIVYCGIGQVAGSDTASPGNVANLGPSYARVDTGCWNRSDHSSPLHELFHTLGAVQPTAPHATAGYHCTDESDALCYSDAVGVTTSQVCPVEQEWQLDCGKDDYFSTAPAIGSYLGTHWNTANSVFLATSLTDVGATPPPATPAPVTATFTGSVSSKKPTVSFGVASGAGDATASLAFTAAGRVKALPSLRLRALAPDGTVLSSATGPSVLSMTARVPAGTSRWEVSGTTSVSFSLTVTHPAA